MNTIRHKETQIHLDQVNLLHRIIDRIRQSEELSEILMATVTEVRTFLKTDRIMIYQFQEDGSGQVVAESLEKGRLPSLFGFFFPADDIPVETRELFLKARLRSIVDVDNRQIAQQGFDGEMVGRFFEEESYRPVDPCHVEYLTAMGVKSSLVLPIIHQGNLWGLFVSHHAESKLLSDEQLHILQLVVDQISVAISQSLLLLNARQQTQQEATLNYITNLLDSLAQIDLKLVLKETVEALGGSGGRLYLQELQETPQVYTYGQQPLFPKTAKYSHLEKYNVCREYFQGTEEKYWAISDLYQLPSWRTLQPAFQSNNIRGILIFCLRYHQKIVGYLTIFRDEINTEKLWAGQFDPDQRQQQPRLSFEVWRESKKGQSQPWLTREIHLGQEIAEHIASGIQQYKMHHQLQSLNTTLEQLVEERTIKLQEKAEQQHILFNVVAKIRESLDLDKIFIIAAQEVRRSLKADRVIVFQFDTNSQYHQGRVIAEDVLPDFPVTLGNQVEDHCFAEKYVTKYSQGRIQVIHNIDESDLNPCHKDLLIEFSVKASLVIPLMKSEHLWGLLGVHQCAQFHFWTDSEIEFVSQIATQLGVAIQQAELLARTQEQTLELQLVTEQQHTLFDVVMKMRQSLDVEKIFRTTTKEVCYLMEVDRVSVYRFTEDWGGEFVSDFESIKPDWNQVGQLGVNTVWDDTFLQETQGGRYKNNETFAVDDVYQAGFYPCHLDILEQFHIKAQIIAPIFVGKTLWGLVAAYQHSGARHWEESEVRFMTQIAAQLGVALQQAELLNQTQKQAQQLADALEDLKRTQSQLIQTEKMSGLGQMVAGIAHEINNPVNFIYGNLSHVSEYSNSLLEMLDLYHKYYPEPHPEIIEESEAIELDFIIDDLPKILSSMTIGADRIRQIVLSLRNFSRLDEAEMKPVSLNEGLDSTLLILQHRLKSKGDYKGIEIVKNYGIFPKIACYAGQLNQVFMNVLCNAIDALEMPASQEKFAKINQRGTIFIDTELVNDSSVLIKIADNGLGMPESVKSRIFDPFFTTKPVGKGTGLGLSISYQIIVEKHRGSFQCLSEPGEGTTFLITIPIEQPESSK